MIPSSLKESLAKAGDRPARQDDAMWIRVAFERLVLGVGDGAPMEDVAAYGKLSRHIERRLREHDKLLAEIVVLRADLVDRQDRWVETVKQRSELRAALSNLLDGSDSTDSYCEACGRHAPKDDNGVITAPVSHHERCFEGCARAAIAKVERKS